MTEARLDDAEAVRILWDSVVVLARDARGLTETADRLTHQVRAFAGGLVNGAPGDAKGLLMALGAAAERCEAIQRARCGVEEAASALGFAFVPNPSPHPLVQAQELNELRERIAARTPEPPPAERRIRPRPRPSPS